MIGEEKATGLWFMQVLHMWTYHINYQQG